YAAALTESLAGVPGVHAELLRPPFASRVSVGWTRSHWIRYVTYPAWAAAQQAHVFHVVDHGNAQLLWRLPRASPVVTLHPLSPPGHPAAPLAGAGGPRGGGGCPPPPPGPAPPGGLEGSSRSPAIPRRSASGTWASRQRVYGWSTRACPRPSGGPTVWVSWNE